MDLSAEKGAHMEAQPGSFRGLCLYNPPPVLPNDRRIEKDSDLPAADRTEMPVRDEGIQDASLGVRGRRSRWHRGTRLSALRKPSASVVSSTLMGRVSTSTERKNCPTFVGCRRGTRTHRAFGSGCREEAVKRFGQCEGDTVQLCRVELTAGSWIGAEGWSAVRTVFQHFTGRDSCLSHLDQSYLSSLALWACARRIPGPLRSTLKDLSNCALEPTPGLWAVPNGAAESPSSPFFPAFFFFIEPSFYRARCVPASASNVHKARRPRHSLPPQQPSP